MVYKIRKTRKLRENNNQKLNSSKNFDSSEILQKSDDQSGSKEDELEVSYNSNLKAVEADKLTRKFDAAERKVIKRSMTIVTIFVLCWTPFYAVRFLNVTEPHISEILNSVET